MSEPLPIPEEHRVPPRKRSGAARTSAIAVIVLLTILVVGISLRTTEVAKVAHSTDRFLFYAGDDSLHLSYGAKQYVFRPADLKTGDTARSFFSDTAGANDLLRLVTAKDSLILRPADTAIWVSIATPTDTITSVFFFREIPSTSHFIQLLKEHATFANTVTGDSHPFTYAADDSNLVRLRTEYKLDSVAGDGDELSRIINLMHWVHATVRHDGSSTNPSPRNALNIIQVCKNENRGVNCRMLATVLNEVYLSMGFKSRHVTCMPFDKQDQDCHVINMVWSNQLAKWLYVDPTFDVMFQDARGNYLSIPEVRRAMIRGDSLVPSADMNWNGQPYDRSEYMRYMAKNLFRFFCPEGSAFGYETNGHAVWIHLDPVDYDSRKPASADTVPAPRSVVDYYTDNSRTFWAKP